MSTATLTANGVLNTAVRTDPFTALGTDIKAARTGADAMRIAGMDWEVEKLPMNNFMVPVDRDGSTDLVVTTIPGYSLIRKVDSADDALGVVSTGRYTPIQNSTVFELADFLLQLGASFEYAGTTRKGARTFISLLLPTPEIKIGGKDLMQFKVSIDNSFDGKGSLVARVRAQRLECTNGMTVQLPGVNHQIAIRHTGSTDEQFAEARRIVQLSAQYMNTYLAVAQELIDTPMTGAEFFDFVDALYPRPATFDTERKEQAWSDRRNNLYQLWSMAETNAEGRSTRWGALNSVTEMLDWGGNMDATRRAARQAGYSSRAVETARQTAFELLAV